MEEEQKTPLTDYYSKPYQGKRYRENSSESFIVPNAIKIIAWLGVMGGTLCLFNGMDGVWIYGLGIIALSIILLGFSTIVKAACKYLDE